MVTTNHSIKLYTYNIKWLYKETTLWIEIKLLEKEYNLFFQYLFSFGRGGPNQNHSYIGKQDWAVWDVWYVIHHSVRSLYANYQLVPIFIRVLASEGFKWLPWNNLIKFNTCVTCLLSLLESQWETTWLTSTDLTLSELISGPCHVFR